mmetsp:Transcript_30440/g.103416  ORF Transcript_30440/g.103416 Transcript_30440/m.103416 type:complete len:113 (-) Transcript_30440:72-410(-)
MTTGITVWSEPFLVTGADGEQLAVVVLDTQGLFDNETPMGLTSCIFGLSTLMSSLHGVRPHGRRRAGPGVDAGQGGRGSPRGEAAAGEARGEAPREARGAQVRRIREARGVR